jgi:hypothetical protein
VWCLVQSDFSQASKTTQCTRLTPGYVCGLRLSARLRPQVREQGPRPPREEERVGLGKVGPLRFRNSRPAAAAAAKASPAKPDAEQ